MEKQQADIKSDRSRQNYKSDIRLSKHRLVPLLQLILHKVANCQFTNNVHV